MAIWRTRHTTGRGSIPFDNMMLLWMVFFMVLATFFAVMSIWAFGLTPWGQRLL
jgi:hypothetical protein